MDALPFLPLQIDLETPAVMKKLATAHRYLAELKGIAETIPNEVILINTLALQEAKDSSEIENIITTHDELYKHELFSEAVKNPASKEVSRYIIKNKSQYYQLLNNVNYKNDWEPWVLYMLAGVEQTSKQTIWIIRNIRQMMQTCKARLKTEHSKIYSHELLNNLLSHPYTKIELLQSDLEISRITAMKYLNLLADTGVIEKEKVGKYNYYINRPLYDLFMDVPEHIED